VSSLRFTGDDIIGYWIDSKKELIVKCYKYSGKYYAVIKWFDNSNKSVQKYSDEGLPKSEWLNYVVMRNFDYDGEKWVNGKIHEIKYGKIYDASIEIKNKDLIVVRGFYYIPLIGKDINFKRYVGDLPKQN